MNDFISEEVREAGKNSPESEFVVKWAAELAAGKESRHWGKPLSSPLQPLGCWNRILPRSLRQQKLLEGTVSVWLSSRISFVCEARDPGVPIRAGARKGAPYSN